MDGVLDQLAVGPLSQDYIRGGTSKTLAGADEFFAAWQASGHQVIEITSDPPGSSAKYRLKPGYKDDMEWFLNDRLAQRSNSATDQT